MVMVVKTGPAVVAGTVDVEEGIDEDGRLLLGIAEEDTGMLREAEDAGTAEEDAATDDEGAMTGVLLEEITEESETGKLLEDTMEDVGTWMLEESTEGETIGTLVDETAGDDEVVGTRVYRFSLAGPPHS